ncbi:ROK family transcriptional regulator [Streptomyces tateyamensis]|uniref:ROK family transcriptional regulator n=1 Tax=Streptomyces tateyamensis TaxID=565073 RepID=A0A2V4N9L0_9ACTN|nr:ROK family transcriptional regulator [Streptomyces tateyamensis]PYC76662.1 ROK family transcriptional regulator [Streptomyces tateyamensis]
MTTARTATPSTARAINDRLALDLLLRQGPLTATELRTLTGLSRPTVADLLERLQHGGLVAIVGERGEERRGPNARLYGLRADRAHLAGVDVRAGGVTFTVADLTGRTVAGATLPIDPEDPAGPPPGYADRVLQALLAAAREAGAGDLHTVTVGAPGLVHPATGQLRPTSLPPHWHTDLVAVLRAGLTGEVILENEVNLAGIAEHRLGAVTDRDTFVLLWLGHGTGAAVMLDGRLRRGASGGTGEIGFLPVPGTGGLPGSLGCDGGFHTLAGSRAVCELARAHGVPVPDGAEDAAAAEAAVLAARAAGTAGEAFLDGLADRVALGATAVCVLLDPGCLVLGGETGRAGGRALADRVAARLAALSPLPTEVRPSATGGGAVLSGAVLTASDAVCRDLFGGP